MATNLNFANIKQQHFNQPLLFLFCLYTCALLMDHGIHWQHVKSTGFLAILVFCQFINYKLWWITVVAALTGLIALLPYFPRLANHGNLEIFVSIVFLVFILHKLIKRPVSISTGTITVMIRYTLITVYFWAGFHKLNTGFFSIDGSCSVHMNVYLNSVVFGENFSPSALFIRISQVGTIFIEMVLPFGLLFYRTRKITAIFLVAFHFYLVLCNFIDFGAFACFLIIGSILNLEKPLSNKMINGLRFYLFISLATVALSVLIKKYKLADDAYQAFLYCNIVFSIGYLVFFTIFFKNYKPLRENHKQGYWPGIAVVFICLWAIQPYIGLSTSGTLTMFSNLVTEKSRNNHYLINTVYTKIWNFEEDYVEIVEFKSSHNLGKLYNLNNYYIPLVEFKNASHAWTRSSDEVVKCTLIYKGDTIRINDLKHSGFIKKEWWTGMLTYRGIPKGELNKCLW